MPKGKENKNNNNNKEMSTPFPLYGYITLINLDSK